MVDYSVVKLMLWFTAAVLTQTSNITIVSFKGSTGTLPCKIASYNYPKWEDQEGIVYNYRGKPAFNQVQLLHEKFSRLEWASNKRDLTIKNVTLQDSGVYNCVVNSWRYYTELVVIAPPDSPALLNTTVVDNMTAIACLQDQSVTITCISRGGYPEPYLDIYMRGIKLHSSKRATQETDNTFTATITSTFNATRENDGINVTCESSYNQPGTKKATSAILYLSLKPSVPVISGFYTATEGSSVELQCTAVGSRPPVNISWYLETTTANQSESILFNDTYKTFKVTSYLTTGPLRKADNMKNITCIVSHETLFSKLAVSQLLNVQFAPDAVHLSGNRLITANGNNTLTLSCKSSSANPVSNLTWIQNGEVLTSIDGNSQRGGKFGGIIREQNLTITPTRSMDDDLIFCIAEHYLLKKNQHLVQNITLNLNYGPKTTIIDGEEKNITEGQTDVKIICTAESKPSSEFSWFKDGENNSLLIGDSETADNTSWYFIPLVNRTQAGQYTCTANNGIGNPQSSSIRLNVHYPPDVTVTTTNTTTNATGVDIECRAAGEPSNYTFSPMRQTWPGTNVHVRYQIHLTATDQHSKRLLHIPFPSFQDTGVYICAVGNGIAIWNTDVVMKTGSVYLLVKSRPIVTMPILDADRRPYKISAKLNVQFSVNVSIYSNVGDIQHKLFRVSNDTLFKVNTSQMTMSKSDVTVRPYETEIITEGFTLHISHIIKEEEHFGLFYLDIVNDVGKVRVPLEIIAEGPPCTPTQIRIDDQGGTTINLSWIRCFHGGFKQTFVVQYSEDGLKWTNGTFIKGGLSQRKDRLNTTVGSLGPGQLYYLRIFAFNEKGMSNFSIVLNGTTNRKEENGNQETSTAGAVAGSLAAITVITLFVFGVLIFRRRISRKMFKASRQNLIVDENIDIKQRQNQTDLRVTGFKTMEEVNETIFDNNEMSALPGVPNNRKIYMHQILDYMQMSSVNCFENLYQEYMKLPVGLVHECLKASQACNSKKNRYRDILAYDHSRVMIEKDNPEESDYINANYIDGYKTGKKFIASQGPTEEMVEDFWYMVLQENSSLIVMLTNLVENKVRKCLQYWPNDGEEIIFGNVKVLLIEAKAFPDYVIRELEVTKIGDMPKRVTQVHFTAWPDKAVPGIAWHLVNVWKKVKALSEEKLGRIVVHCRY